jgi:hypothetical protein
MFRLYLAISKENQSQRKLCADVDTYHNQICSINRRYKLQPNTGHTQKNGAVLIVNTIKTAPFFCVCPVLVIYKLIKTQMFEIYNS